MHGDKGQQLHYYCLSLIYAIKTTETDLKDLDALFGGEMMKTFSTCIIIESKTLHFHFLEQCQ